MQPQEIPHPLRTYSSKLLIPLKMNDWNIHWTWSQFFCWYPKVWGFRPDLRAHQSPIAGVLPPVLCAPFDDPDDFDDIAAGVPMLHGLRRRSRVQTTDGTHLLCLLCSRWILKNWCLQLWNSMKFLLLGFEWIWHFLLITVVQVL